MSIDPNKKRWQVTDILVSLFILIIAYVLSAMISSAFFKASILFEDIFDKIFMLAPIYYLNNKYPLTIFSRFNKEDLKYFVMGITLCTIMNIFSFISTRSTGNIPEQYSLFMGYDIYQKSLYLSFFFIVGPLLEEIFCRGFIFRILRNRYNIFWGALGSTIIFSLFHGLRIEIIGIGISGLIYVYVYHKTQSIPLTALTHSVDNVLISFLGYGLQGR